MIARVRLRVADLDRVRAYYRRTIGLHALSETALGVDGTPLIELIGDPSAPPAPPGSTGLFHLALLVPDRPSLARAVAEVLPDRLGVPVLLFLRNEAAALEDQQPGRRLRQRMRDRPPARSGANDDDVELIGHCVVRDPE
jgi:catechol 2,3-dioxygenase